MIHLTPFLSIIDGNPIESNLKKLKNIHDMGEEMINKTKIDHNILLILKK